MFYYLSVEKIFTSTYVIRFLILLRKACQVRPFHVSVTLFCRYLILSNTRIMFTRPFFLLLLIIVLQDHSMAQKQKIKIARNKVKIKNNRTVAKQSNLILPAAEQMDKYLPLLKGKKIALLVNQTSVVGNTHLIDTLLKRGVNIKVVFGPEHGFRGEAPDGAKIETTRDKKTGIAVISLYGKKTKPTPDDLKDVDALV